MAPHPTNPDQVWKLLPAHAGMDRAGTRRNAVFGHAEVYGDEESPENERKRACVLGRARDKQGSVRLWTTHSARQPAAEVERLLAARAVWCFC